MKKIFIIFLSGILLASCMGKSEQDEQKEQLTSQQEESVSGFQELFTGSIHADDLATGDIQGSPMVVADEKEPDSVNFATTTENDAF